MRLREVTTCPLDPRARIAQASVGDAVNSSPRPTSRRRTRLRRAVLATMATAFAVLCAEIVLRVMDAAATAERDAAWQQMTEMPNPPPPGQPAEMAHMIRLSRDPDRTIGSESRPAIQIPPGGGRGLGKDDGVDHVDDTVGCFDVSCNDVGTVDLQHAAFIELGD